MELFKNLDTPQSKEFEKIINNQLSKNKIEEGKKVRVSTKTKELI